MVALQTNWCIGKLEDHKQRKHLNPTEYECTLCRKKYKCLDHFNRHTTKCTGEDLSESLVEVNDDVFLSFISSEENIEFRKVSSNTDNTDIEINSIMSLFGAMMMIKLSQLYVTKLLFPVRRLIMVRMLILIVDESWMTNIPILKVTMKVLICMYNIQ